MSQLKDKNPEYFFRFQENDPEYHQQQEQYGKAIPSRNFILELLEYDQNLDFDGVARSFKLRKVWELDALENRLNAMIRADRIYLNNKNIFKIADPDTPIIGIVKGHAEGFGYLKVDNSNDSLFIPPHEMKSLLHGDHVEALSVSVDHRGRRIAKITKILDRGFSEFFGRLYLENGTYTIIPENRQIAHEFLVQKDQTKNAKPLDIVRAKITTYPDTDHIASAEVVEVFGETVTVDIEIQQALLTHNIPHIFSEITEHEVEAIPSDVTEKDREGRKDYRDLPLVTIDGITARDFDDAVYCEPLPNGGYKLYVAIADVSHYVSNGSSIDNEAYERGTSVYFPNRVIPMLHHALSNGICSLNPEVDRLCMVSELEIDKQGDITSYQFFEGVIRSHARLTYDLVFEIIDGDELLRQSYSHLTPHLDHLYTLFKILRKKRDERGGIDFDTTETLILYDEEGNIEKIIPDERNDAHKIIEECMINANIAAASFLEENEIPTLYRVHLPPETSKINQLRSFLKEFNLGLRGGDTPTPHDFADTLEQAKKRDEFEMIQTVMLRSLSQAVYQPENNGHFGLSLTHYAHFTSPIRRYPDLLVHRAIKHILHKKRVSDFYSTGKMVQFGEHTSMTERRADDAVRDVMDWLKAKYLQNFIGNEFEGHITGVTNFGIFVELKDIYVEGLVHISTITGDYYLYDDTKHRLIGERTHQQYRLNDKVTIKIIESNPETKHIDFELISPIIKETKGRNGTQKPKIKRVTKADTSSKKRVVQPKSPEKKKSRRKRK